MAPNITYTTTYYNSTFAIEESLQQQNQANFGFPFLGFNNTLVLSELQVKVKVAPRCCIWYSLTSTTHRVARGLGQDQKLWGEGKDRRTVTGQREHSMTNLSLFSSLEAVHYVLIPTITKKPMLKQVQHNYIETLKASSLYIKD